MMDRQTGRPRGFGFVTYAEGESVENALNAKDLKIKDKQVEIKRAMPKTKTSTLPNTRYTTPTPPTMRNPTATSATFNPAAAAAMMFNPHQQQMAMTAAAMKFYGNQKHQQFNITSKQPHNESKDLTDNTNDQDNNKNENNRNYLSSKRHHQSSSSSPSSHRSRESSRDYHRSSSRSSSNKHESSGGGAIHPSQSNKSTPTYRPY